MIIFDHESESLMIKSSESYLKQHGIDFLDKTSPVNFPEGYTVDPSFSLPYPPILDELAFLHQLAVSRRVFTILEFGCGYSTEVFATALKNNHNAYLQKGSPELRKENKFEIHSLEESEKYKNVLKSRVNPELVSYMNIHRQNVIMSTFQGRFCTQFSELPNICPDLIYLDGPSQNAPKNTINGISTHGKDRVPMAADILFFEHFLHPGCLIVADGRDANVRFLKSNLQRNWAYTYEQSLDKHCLELVEAPLGPHNKKVIDYCLGSDWYKNQC